MTFTWWGKELAYETGEYNDAAQNERTVEVPVARHFIGRQSGARGLEVGNVLAHYGPAPWVVVDRDEIAPGVDNTDLFDLRWASWDWIVCISTVEHTKDPVAAVAHLAGLLVPQGELLVTVPLGSDEALDQAIAARSLGVRRECTLVHEADGWWRQTPQITWLPYGSVNAWAASVWIGEFVG